MISTQSVAHLALTTPGVFASQTALQLSRTCARPMERVTTICACINSMSARRDQTIPITITEVVEVGHIFRILRHFATKLCNSSNFKMLFLTVVKIFVPYELCLVRPIVCNANCPLFTRKKLFAFFFW